jgi:hypothetical protein
MSKGGRRPFRARKVWGWSAPHSLWTPLLIFWPGLRFGSGICVQVTSGPPEIVSPPLPVPNLLVQPRPCSSMLASSGSGPTRVGAPAPWVAVRVHRGAACDGAHAFTRHVLSDRAPFFSHSDSGQVGRSFSHQNAVMTAVLQRSDVNRAVRSNRTRTIAFEPADGSEAAEGT